MSRRKLILLPLLLLFSNMAVTAQTSNAPVTSPVSSPASKPLTLTPAELQAALDDAWNKGYKAATESLAPQAAAQKALLDGYAVRETVYKTSLLALGGVAIAELVLYLWKK